MEVPDEWTAALALAYLAAEGARGPLRLLKDHAALEVWCAKASMLRQWSEGESGCLDEGGSASRSSWIARFVARRPAVDGTGIRAAVEAAGVHFVPFSSHRYPNTLRQLEHPPAGIFVRGDVEAMQAMLEAPAVSIVGTRRATSYGLAVTDMLARAFANEGIMVVSGLAFGIDAQAHRGCLSSAGSTVAVLGTGAEAPYPRRHAELYERIGRHGAVISEVPPGAPLYRWRFPLRNRLMAALGDALFVTEAGERSGALNTANWALELGRPVFAVPGPILGSSSLGTNRLVGDGAIPCLDIHEAVEDFLSVTRLERESRGASLPGSRLRGVGRDPADGSQDSLATGVDSTSQGVVLLALGNGPRTVDEVARVSGLSVREASSDLSFLEARGRVVRLGQGLYRLT